mmetsp:Transcript_22818/g.38611  ORF Transcript_22818/g.38611 Transcript_22818/m.38611 type:complete len:103 (+) Transcript_22818:174-482(+)
MTFLSPVRSKGVMNVTAANVWNVENVMAMVTENAFIVVDQALSPDFMIMKNAKKNAMIVMVVAELIANSWIVAGNNVTEAVSVALNALAMVKWKSTLKCQDI